MGALFLSSCGLSWGPVWRRWEKLLVGIHSCSHIKPSTCWSVSSLGVILPLLAVEIGCLLHIIDPPSTPHSPTINISCFPISVAEHLRLWCSLDQWKRKVYVSLKPRAHVGLIGQLFRLHHGIVRAHLNGISQGWNLCCPQRFILIFMEVINARRARIISVVYSDFSARFYWLLIYSSLLQAPFCCACPKTDAPLRGFF